MVLKINECEQIMNLAKIFDRGFFDKNFKYDKKGIFVFENNFVMFDKYRAVIIKTSESVKGEYLFELTSKMIKGFVKYSDIALFEDLNVLKIQTQDAFKSTIAVLEKLKDTYSKDEDTLKIKM